jgi:hypothetical protein
MKEDYISFRVNKETDNIEVVFSSSDPIIFSTLLELVCNRSLVNSTLKAVLTNLKDAGDIETFEAVSKIASARQVEKQPVVKPTEYKRGD